VAQKEGFSMVKKGSVVKKSISAWLEKGMVKKVSFSMPEKNWTDRTGPTYENSETDRRRRRRTR
jgi:hypothetical protein